MTELLGAYDAAYSEGLIAGKPGKRSKSIFANPHTTRRGRSFWLAGHCRASGDALIRKRGKGNSSKIEQYREAERIYLAKAEAANDDGDST